MYVYDLSEFSEDDYDYIVYVPDTLTFDSGEMAAIVDKYRLAPKRFTIKTYPVI